MIVGGYLNSYLCNQDPPFPPEYSAKDLIDSSFPPTFVIVATADTLIQPAQSYEFYVTLQKHGIQCGLSEAKGMEHGRSEKSEDTELAEREYKVWFQEAIQPGLKWVVEMTRNG